MSRAAHWTLADVIDFEHLLAEREGQDERALGLEVRGNRREAFRAWLDARRSEIAKPSPGQAFTAGWQLVLALALVSGLLLGGALCGALLAYPGAEPINAPLFFACTAGAQMAILLAGLLGWMLRRWLGKLFGELAPMRALLGSMINAIGVAGRQWPGEQRENARAAMGVLERRHEIYGSLAVWPLLLVTQLFAIAFNAGILGTMLAVHLPMTELRFGWQSTYDLPPESMHRIVSALATPWKKLAPPGQPTAEQIAETRYSHGQSAQSVPAGAARSWWPFLAWSVAVYGLLPRAVLFVFAAIALRRKLDHLPFDHAEANALWRRLSGPVVKAGAVVTGEAPATGEMPASDGEWTAGECIVLVAAEFSVDEKSLRERLADHYGWHVRGIYPAAIDNRHASEDALGRLRRAYGLGGVAVIIPADRDPIVAIALFLRAVTEAVGGKVEVLVLLAGPVREEEMVPVGDDRIAIWRRFRNAQRLRPGIEPWP